MNNPNPAAPAASVTPSTATPAATTKPSVAPAIAPAGVKPEADSTKKV